MLQIYFLSVFFNLAAGFSLAFETLSKRMTRLTALTELVNWRRGRTSLGLGVLLVGFITLFVPAGGSLIIGDLLSSVVGMVMGIALLFEVFRQDTMFPSESVDKLERTPSAYRTTLGLLGIAVAILHFFLPERLFL